MFCWELSYIITVFNKNWKKCLKKIKNSCPWFQDSRLLLKTFIFKTEFPSKVLQLKKVERQQSAFWTVSEV